MQAVRRVMQAVQRFAADHGSVFWLCLPLVFMLFWSVPWEGDPRTAEVVERIVKLRASSWPWDQAEFSRLLQTTDVNSMVDGMPLFVKLAIEGKDEVLLKQMIKLGANVNSSDWGCTPLLAAFAADKRIDAGERYEVGYGKGSRLVKPTFALIVMRAGADPGVFPSIESVNRRLSTGIPKVGCQAYDEALKIKAGMLDMALDFTDEDEMFRLLLDRGVKPKGRKEVLDVLDHYHVKGADQGTALFEIRKLALSELAKMGEPPPDEKGARTNDTPLTYSIESMGWNVLDVARLLKDGADPNGRSSGGILPLEGAIHHCMAGGDRSVFVSDWRKSDKETQARNREVALLIGLLLRSGADPNLPARRYKDHPSLFAQAVSMCSSDIPRLLLENGAKVDKASIEAAVFDLKELLQSRFDKPESSRGTAGSVGNPH